MDYPVVALIVVLVVILVLVYALSGAGTLIATSTTPKTLKLGNGTTNVVVPAYVDYNDAEPSTTNRVVGLVLNNSPAGSLVRLFNNTSATIAVGYGTTSSGAVDSSKYVVGFASAGQFLTNNTAICTKLGIRAQDWRCAPDN